MKSGQQLTKLWLSVTWHLLTQRTMTISVSPCIINKHRSCFTAISQRPAVLQFISHCDDYMIITPKILAAHRWAN